MAVYNGEHLARIGGDLRDVIDAVTLGQGGWDDFVARLGKEFPGAFVAMIGRSDTRPALNFMVSHNLDPDFAAAFTSHYAAINPWNRNWAAMRSGDILISEDVAPARMFRNGAFYEEWLRPQGRVEAGAGLELRNGGGDQVFVSLHYDVARHQDMAPALQALYVSMRGHLARSVRLAERLSAAHDDAVGEAALLQRGGDCALIVGRDMTIRGANDVAEAALVAGDFLRSERGRLSVGPGAAQAMIARTVGLLAAGAAVDRSEFHLRAGDQAWRIWLTALPCLDNDFVRPFRSSRRVLLLARCLAQGGAAGLAASFAELYALTPAEVVFCERILAGLTVEQAADELRVSRETARQRLKSIFRKTDTHRQTQLLALLMRAR